MTAEGIARAIAKDFDGESDEYWLSFMEVSREIDRRTRSQAIDDCIKVVREAVEKDGVEEWRGTAIAEFIASRLEALKGST